MKKMMVEHKRKALGTQLLCLNDFGNNRYSMASNGYSNNGYSSIIGLVLGIIGAKLHIFLTVKC